MIGMQFRRTIGTKISRYQVFTVEVISYTSEEWHNSPLRCPRTCIIPRYFIGSIQCLNLIATIVWTVDPAIWIVWIRPWRTGHYFQAMFLEVFIISQYIIKCQHCVHIPIVRSLTVLIAAPSSRNRIKKSGINGVATVKSKSRLKLQFRKWSQQYITRCQQAVFFVFVIFRAGHIF